MTLITIYKIERTGYFLHGNQKTESGIRIACDPFVRSMVDTEGLIEVAETLKKYLDINISHRAKDIKDWTEFRRNFFEKAGLNSRKLLSKLSTRCVHVAKTDNNYIFSPTYHDPGDSSGYMGKAKEENIVIPATVSVMELTTSLTAAFDRCN